MRRFPVRFDKVYGVVSTALFLPPSDAFVEVDDAALRVQMGWAFRAHFRRSAVVSAALDGRRPLSRGVHGLAGRWLVNGSADGLVNIGLQPAQCARVLGFLVKVRELLVSVEEPEALVAALNVNRGG